MEKSKDQDRSKGLLSNLQLPTPDRNLPFVWTSVRHCSRSSWRNIAISLITGRMAPAVNPLPLTQVDQSQHPLRRNPDRDVPIDPACWCCHLFL
jgi:hypothetical protein